MGEGEGQTQGGVVWSFEERLVVALVIQTEEEKRQEGEGMTELKLIPIDMLTQDVFGHY